MEKITVNSTGPAVEDAQQRLVVAGYLAPDEVDGVFGPRMVEAVGAFCRDVGLPEPDGIDERTWTALVNASFEIGERSLYLRMPYFHGRDVLCLQRALGALGFNCGDEDGIFGAHTELALRKFQLNLGLFSDGIAGSQTFAAIRNLHHSWEGKEAVHTGRYLGFARAADALESRAICLFGTCDFARDVASRMSNLSLATNPASKILSADALLVDPDEDMLMMHLVLPGERVAEKVPRVSYMDEETLGLRLQAAIGASNATVPPRVVVELPSAMWLDASAERSAQHFAITLLDGLCVALARN